jgi:glycosyltransferase involved in cell wall biosynthesis
MREEYSARSKFHFPPCSFVLPCLNESLSLKRVIPQIQNLHEQFDSIEILVVDNGSNDNSVELAKQLGARVLHCQERGYGAALQAGIANASNEIIVFADADGTYDWDESVHLVNSLLLRGADLVVGNRLNGKIEERAMPFLNRHFGTPALSLLITLLYGIRRGIRVGDCNGGMRALRASAYARWKVTQPGMEFASEMIVRALKSGAQYTETNISYRRSTPGRQSHLRRWADGWRHLKLILSLI